MTEQQWTMGQDPAAMLQALMVGDLTGATVTVGGQTSSLKTFKRHPSATDRKLRLFACACTRQVWHLLSDRRSRRAVEVAERFADGMTTDEELSAADARASQVLGEMDGVPAPEFMAAWVADKGLFERLHECWYLIEPDQCFTQEMLASHANLLREVLGNPCRPVTLPKGQRLVPIGPFETDYGTVDEGWEDTACPWLTSLVLSLAQVAYEERTGRPSTSTPQKLLAHLLDVGRTDSLGGMCLTDAGRGRMMGDDRLSALAVSLQRASDEDRGVPSYIGKRGLTLTHWHTGNGHLSSTFQLMAVDCSPGEPKAWQIHLKNDVAEAVIRKIAGDLLAPGWPVIEDGSLDPDRLGVLADALEDAGCNDVPILRHLRGQELIPRPNTGDPPLAWYEPLRAPHVRGCWVLDLLLGRE